MDFGPSSNALWPADDYAADKALCIEFANTVSWRGKQNPDDHLPDASAWLGWLSKNDVLPSSALQAMSQRATACPEEADAAFEKAIVFREATYNLLYACCQDEEAMAKSRMLVQDILSRALSRLRFVQAGETWSFELETGTDWEAALYGPALSTAQLLTSPYADRVKVCERDECRWLFLDHTKNHSRKWCDMTTCGNVVKARASYARRKAKAQA